MPLPATDYPPITETEKALTEIKGQPGCPAVVLFEKGRFEMEPNGKGSNSVFRVRARIKILTEEGKRYGEIELRHSTYRRLLRLVGRTVLPDGTILELSKDQIFKRRTSRLDRRYATVAAFPGVEVGAILDYQYDISYETIFELQPWLFQSRVPTLRSEIAYVVPDYIGFRPWSKAMPDRLEVETIRQHPGRMIVATMRNLPGIPNEPFSYPIEDLSNQFMVLPTEYVFSGSGIDLLVSWKRVCDLFDDSYDRHRKGRGAKRQAQYVATGSGQMEQARAIFTWVRDQIELEPIRGVSTREDASVDRVLTDHRGDPVDKALLLQAMLDAVKIKADLVWVTYRSNGIPDLNTPNPGWFDAMIVRAEIGGETVFLDPSDNRVGFAQLSPVLEGTSALIWDPRNPQAITLPETPFSENQRQATIELALAADGRVSGRGELELTGHHAWNNMRREDSAGLTEHWQSWLEEKLDSFQISEVSVSEKPDNRRISISWKMEQGQEDALGDEVSLALSRPLGPVTQPFKTTVRYTPVLLAFTNRDQLQLTITWPEGWIIDVKPRPDELKLASGEIVATVEVDEEKRSLHYSRRLDLTARNFIDSNQLVDVQRLFERFGKHDAQQLVLVRR